ncbi:MAG: ABC transporter permease subunit, partial [Chloroflexi bacterium]|nr:ABC transporter permease subunit [Chloroflexota bacterium]
LAALFAAWLWSSLGVGTAVLQAGLMAIGREYTELALVEGAGPLWRLRRVTLPGLRRALLVVLLINAALGAQVFDLIFVTTGGGPGYATMLLPLEMYGRAFGQQAGQGAAAACVQVALGLVLAAVALLLAARGGESFDSGERQEARARRDGGFAPTAALGAILIVMLLPPGWLLVAALERGRTFALGGSGPGLDPRAWEWSNFTAVWNAGMGGAIGTSLTLALGAVAATLCLAVPAAYALAYLIRPRLWRSGGLILLLAGLLQPTPVLIIPLFSLLKDLGLLDSVWGILLPEVARSMPFAILVLWGFMAQLPREVLQAAQVDGASPFQQMLRIAAPLVRPALVAVATWAFVTSWNEYLLPTLVSQDASIQTVPTLLASFVGSYDTQYGLLAAGSLMAIAPSLIIYLLLRRPASAGLVRAGRTMR